MREEFASLIKENRIVSGELGHVKYICKGCRSKFAACSSIIDRSEYEIS